MIEALPKNHTRTRTGLTDKRAALLSAATELFARKGVNNVSTSAIARKAGVANGTLFFYFETKNRLINILYLEIVDEFISSIEAVLDPQESLEANMRSYWFGLARWHFDNSDAANVRLQCEISSVLTPESKAGKDAMETEMVRTYFPGLLDRMDRATWRLNYAFIAGPIQVLAQLRDKGEIEITDELLEETYARVERAITLL